MKIDEISARVGQAADILSDPKLKAEYDLQYRKAGLSF